MNLALCACHITQYPLYITPQSIAIHILGRGLDDPEQHEYATAQLQW
jgi:hypothetical protein